jgi:hypothetical protein
MRIEQLSTETAVALVDATETALVVQETCLGTASYTFDPPLISTPQATTCSASFKYQCTGLDPAITSATITRTGSTQSHCNIVPAFPTLTVRWSNGKESVITFTRYTSTDAAVINLLVGTGCITSGEFIGATAVQTQQFQLSDIRGCADANPMASLTGTSELDITGV